MTPTKSYPYAVVNVFTTEPLSGNSLAVFPDASEFDTETMQKIARELNLTETRVCASGNATGLHGSRAHIYANEGNALRGTSHRWHGLCAAPKRNRIEQLPRVPARRRGWPEPLRIEAGTPPLIWLRTPAIHEGRCLDGSLCERALGLEPHDLLAVEPQMLNAGNPTVVVAVKDKAAVDRAWLDLSGLSAG